jgi:HEPN domain-containing protein
MEKEKQVKYWIEAAEYDLPTIDHLYEKDDFVWALFIGHLVLEKILKALYVDINGITAPRTHDLVKLAKSIGINFNEEQIAFLDEANEFNIEARYPEDKFLFYKKCNKEYTKLTIVKIKETYLWLRSQII